MKITIIVGLATALTVTAYAGPRSSTHYTVPTDTTDSGGRRVASASYTHDGSVGGISGISTVAVPAEVARAGYIGQLYEVSGLQLAATPVTVNEGGTRQLSAAQLLDDSTTIALAATSIAWSVPGGPLSGIDAAGLATADLVFQDTPATAQGDFAGDTGTVVLTVLDSIPDNFGLYAGDGLADDWQVQFFGLDNPNAGPLLDPDDDGQNNTFESIAGLDPTNALSRFVLTIAAVPDQPDQTDLIFDPIVGGRSYTVMTRLDLTTGSWTPLAGGTSMDDGTQRTVTDLNASEAWKFYSVEIENP